MSIRHYIDLNCRPREELGPEDLLDLYLTWLRAERLAHAFRDRYGDDVEESKMQFEETVQRLGEDPIKRKSTVAELRERCAPLAESAHHCTGCPAAVDGNAFSCIHQVNFPVSQLAEHWLLQQLAPEGTRCFELFADAARSLEYGKSPLLERWRAAGFFEAHQPISEQRGEASVTSDQLLHELFLVGDLMPQHALGVLLHFQALGTDDGREGDEVLQMIEAITDKQSAADAPSLTFAIEPSAEDDDSTRELKTFLFCLFRSFSLQVPLAVRL